MITNNALEPVINAFAEVEKHSIRVHRIELTREDYYKVITSREFFLHGCNNPDLVGKRLTNAVVGYRYLGELWGAGIEIISEGKSRVYGEPGFFPSRDIYDSLDSQAEFSAEIQFDGLKYKFKYLKNNLTIIIKSRADFLVNYPRSEWAAIETLREMITEKEFRKYLIYGFILIKGKSGNIYQIFRNRPHTKVWKNGKLIEEICVRIHDSKIPPTDNVIAFKTIIETHEDEFKKLGNVYKMIA